MSLKLFNSNETNTFDDFEREFNNMLYPFNRLTSNYHNFHNFHNYNDLMNFSKMDKHFNFHEDDNQYTYEIEVPGIPKEQIKVFEKHGQITVSGERKLKKEDNKDGYKFVGMSHGSFNRSFRLPKNTDREHIDAKYEDGVLTLTVPKKEVTETESKPLPIH